jgi:hypothetical protein
VNAIVSFRLLVCSVASVVVGVSGIANAQSVALPIAPKPNQVIHVIATQEFAITMSGAAAATAGETQLQTRSLLGYTQSSGRFDDNGRMEAQIAIDRIESEQTINGSTKSSPSVASAVGRSVTAVLDPTGKLVDLQVPADLQSVAIMLKQLIGSTFMTLNVLPAGTLSIGQSATTRSAVPMRIGGGDKSDAYPTRTITTLRAIGTTGQDRIAHFDQRIEATEESATLVLKGAGTIDLNLDRGFVSASTAEWTFTGTYSDAGGAGAKQPMRATFKTTLTANE